MKIRKQEWVTVEIDAKLPYYYDQNLSSEYRRCHIYGKIEDQKCTTVEITHEDDGDKTIQISVSEHSSVEKSGLGCYFTKEFESSEEEYLEKMDEAKQFIQSL